MIFKHLYVIGNGFDLFTGLKTRYSDFRQWLNRNYIFVYEALVSTYGITGEWWNDFENQLGKLDIPMYVSKYPAQEKTYTEILEEICTRKEQEKMGDGIPNLYPYSSCAHRLEGLLDILQYCFEKWVQYEQQCHRESKFTHILKENSFFINFNYTDTLERHYNIPEDQVLHIHGRASNHEHLVFGHDGSLGDTHNYDEEKVSEILGRYEKNPYIFIYRYDLFEKITNIEHIHILGFSFSDIDIPYIQWIADHTSSNCDWEVSWFSEIDKIKIKDFLLYNPKLKGHFKLIQLSEKDNSE